MTNNRMNVTAADAKSSFPTTVVTATASASSDSVRVVLVMPAYNSEAYIADAIDSVLHQTMPVRVIQSARDGMRCSDRWLVAGVGLTPTTIIELCLINCG